jgi:hypothetical protein
VAAVRVVFEVRRTWRGRAILQPIIACWRIVAAKALQKRVGGGGFCVDCKALEGGGLVDKEHVVHRYHICVELPSFT